MFGYKYGISKDDKGNKILSIDINLDYICKTSLYKEKITQDIVERILDIRNPIGFLTDKIDAIYNADWR